MKLDRIADEVALFAGLRRWLACLLAGALAALAMPPLGLWPVLAVAFPVAVWVLDGTTAAAPGLARYRSAAAAGWWFGFGYFFAGLWWIGSAFLVQADVFGWMMPFAVLAMPAGLALFTALGFVLAYALWVPGPARILAFALGLGTAEFLRGVVLTGFPWNAFGYALAEQAWLGQAASVVGVEGLTFLALAIFAAPATLVDVPRRRLPAALAAATLLLLAGFGAVRLAGAEVQLRQDVRLRILQPAIPQDDKFRPSAGPEILQQYIALSGSATGPDRTGLSDVDLLIWPESAFPFLLGRAPLALAEIADALPPGTTLITGAARGEETGGPRLRIFNSVQVVAEDGTIERSYDKVHLVPFGEYLPFQSAVERLGIQQLTRLPGGFAAGESRRNLVLDSGLRLRPLICYEAIFPGEVVSGDERPDALLNVTNDGWFGRTWGPYQHFAMSRVRSIEQGLPLVRAANTGISAIIDSYGRDLQTLTLGARGVLDGYLPATITPTIYARAGRLATLAVFFLCAIGYVTTRRVV